MSTSVVKMRERYTEYMYTKMRFGKYKGFFVKDIPEDYIKWATLNLTDKVAAEMFKIELLRRHKEMR